MKIDLTIGYDDLSKECKEQIKNLQTLGYDVQLHYPALVKTLGTDWLTYNRDTISMPYATEPGYNLTTGTANSNSMTTDQSISSASGTTR